MSRWVIYDKTGTTPKCAVEKLEYSGTFMGVCNITCNISSSEPIDFAIGDYLDYRGERFYINYDPTILKKSARKSIGDAFYYENVVLNSATDELSRCDFLDYVLSDNQYHFTALPNFGFYAASVKDLADRIQANLDRVYKGAQKWTVKVHPEFIGELNVPISANSMKVWDALALVNTTFKGNFIIRNRTITIGTEGITASKIFKYGRGNGLVQIERNADSEQGIITRLRAYGSTRNMPFRYYNKLSGADGKKFVPDNMAVNFLMLPEFPEKSLDPYLDSKNVTELGVREGTVFFDGSSELEEIYPSIEGMTAAQLSAAGIQVDLDEFDNGHLDEVSSAEQATDDGLWENLKEGEDVPQFIITIKDLGFDINKCTTTETRTISMKSGMCGGREFEIVKCVKAGNKNILTCNRVKDESINRYFPYKDYNIKPKDKFVLIGIEMPEVYIKAAAQRLLKAATEFLAKNDYVRYVYTPKIDDIFMARQHDNAAANKEASLHDTLKEGDMIMFSDDDLGVNGNIIIDTLNITEGGAVIPHYEVTLRNEKSVGTIEKIQQQIDSIIGGGGGGLNTEQVASIIRAFGDKRFLRKDIIDATNYLVKLLGGAEIGESVDSMAVGKGTILDPKGRIQTDRIEVRHSMTVQELIYNRRSSMEGDFDFTDSGTIERVQKSVDGTFSLYLRKRWENDFTSLKENDIIYGVVRNLSSQAAEYYTSWMRIVSVDTAANKLVATLYPDAEVPGGKNYEPTNLMMVVHRGNPVNKERQGYWYISTNERCMCMLDGVTKPILEENNYSIIIGRLKHLSIFTNLPINYLQSYVYCRGIATQDLFEIDYQGGVSKQEVNRMYWSLQTAQTEPYLNTEKEYHVVSHYGCQWMCLLSNTLQEPKFGCTDWAMLRGNPEFTIDLESSNGWGEFDVLTFETTISVTGSLYNQDVTDKILPEDVSWSRDTGDVTEDNAWNAAHAAYGLTLRIDKNELGPRYLEMRRCKFTATALLRDGQQVLRDNNSVIF